MSTIVRAPRERYWAATNIRPFSRIPTTKPCRMLAAVNARRSHRCRHRRRAAVVLVVLLYTACSVVISRILRYSLQYSPSFLSSRVLAYHCL